MAPKIESLTPCCRRRRKVCGRGRPRCAHRQQLDSEALCRSRVQDHRQRMAESGEKRVEVRLPAATLEQLQQLCQQRCLNRRELLIAMIEEQVAALAATEEDNH